MRVLIYPLFFVMTCVLWSCNDENQPKTVIKEKVVLPIPFKKMENIEVRPGLTFDILNWGRGVDSLNAVLILRSDTLKNSNTSYNLEIDGKYFETFNTDMDTDGNPEILVITSSNKKFNPANVYCLEYSSSEPNQIRFPDLTEKTKKQYKGGDKFYIYHGKLRREFHLYDNLDDDKAKPIGKKTIEYSIKGNTFDLTEIKDLNKTGLTLK